MMQFEEFAKSQLEESTFKCTSCGNKMHTASPPNERRTYYGCIKCRVLKCYVGEDDS